VKPEHAECLNAIVESSDPSVRPADRLKAIELLRGVADVQECPMCSEVASLSDSELDRHVDAYNAGLAYEALANPERLPQTAAALKQEIERRVEARLREFPEKR
jgi:hypothetical protein